MENFSPNKTWEPIVHPISLKGCVNKNLRNKFGFLCILFYWLYDLLQSQVLNLWRFDPSCNTKDTNNVFTLNIQSKNTVSLKWIITQHTTCSQTVSKKLLSHQKVLNLSFLSPFCFCKTLKFFESCKLLFQLD